MKSDPFLFVSSDGSEEVYTYSEEQVEKYRDYYGLNDPLGVQFVKYLKNTLKGNLGFSIYMNKPVIEIIKGRVFWTLGIVTASMILGLIFGIVLGGLNAWFKDKIFSKILYGLMVGISQFPSFIVGFGILVLFSTKIRILPVSGGITPFKELEFTLDVAVDILRHSILPILTLFLLRLPEFMILTRNSMINEIEKPYVLTARAKGIRDNVILFKHCLRNAIQPVLTRFFHGMATMFNGAIVVENVFNYPGIGRLMREAVFLRDYSLLQGIFLFVAILTLLFSWLIELYYKRTSGEGEI